MVTKQQQLKWLAKKYKTWPEQGATSLGLSVTEVGKFAIVNCHLITRQEWRQERDKMGSKPEVDNSWHERGELPPVGGVCEAMINGEWIAAEVLRHRINSAGMNVAAVMSCASFGVYWAADFRPLRTEREKAIDAACKAIGVVGEDGLLMIERLYDAGLLK